MGATYANLTIKGPTQDQIFAFVADRAAYVSAAATGCVLLLDQLSEWEPEYELVSLATALSMKFSCSVLTVKVSDGDVLAYWLHTNGRFLDWYNSFSGETIPGIALNGPSGGKPEALIGAFGAGDARRLHEILRTKHGSGRYSTEETRHADLIKQLGLPESAVGIGYDYFCRGVAGNGSLPAFHATSHTSC